MVDMTDKYSVIIKDKNGITIDAVNIVGASFDEVQAIVKEQEEETGNTYIILKDEYLFDAIYLKDSRNIEIFSKLYEIRDDINEFIKEKIVRKADE